MSLRHRHAARSNSQLAVEFGVVTAALVGVSLWRRVTRLVTDPLSAALGPQSTVAGLPAAGLVTSGLFVVGLVLFAGGYAAFRDLDRGPAFPSREHLRAVGLAGSVPLVAVGAAALVGALTGVSYGSLTGMGYATDPPLLPVLTVVGLSLAIGVPSLVVVCQVLVQGTLERVFGSERVVLPTALATWFAMSSTAGGLATAPEAGKLVGAVLFVSVFGAGVYASRRAEPRALRRVAFVPALLFAAVLLTSNLVESASVAGGAFALAHLAVFGVAAYVYERSGSLLVPAFAYLSLSLANYGVVLAFETNVLAW